jgi:hypothetical protein
MCQVMDEGDCYLGYCACSLVEIYRYSRDVIALMVEAVSTPETSVISARLHYATTQETGIFILAAVRT